MLKVPRQDGYQLEKVVLDHARDSAHHEGQGDVQSKKDLLIGFFVNKMLKDALGVVQNHHEGKKAESEREVSVELEH